MSDLDDLARFLQSHPSVREKAAIHHTYDAARPSAGSVPLGDDCAVLPDGDGHLLFAAEGMLPGFVAADPWFAGYCAVMVNLSDIAAMGGRALAITDVLATPNPSLAETVWDGMHGASATYGIPIVGGHTTRGTQAPSLAAAILGRAGKNLITSFQAHPGDTLIAAIDLRGEYRGDPGTSTFWNASSDAPPERLRADLELLPHLAERGFRLAGKDISNGGLIGTLAMLLHCSRVGGTLELEAIPRPAAVPLARWLIAFPSFGFLLATPEDHAGETVAHFSARGIATATCGRITGGDGITLTAGGNSAALDFSRG